MARYNFKHNVQHRSLWYACLTATVAEIEEYCAAVPYGETYLVIERLDFSCPNNCVFNIVREPRG